MIAPSPILAASRDRRRMMRRPSFRRLFLVDHLDLAQATGVDDARWEHFQIDHLDDEGIFRIENKSRQIAWSWLTAAEAVAEAHADLWGDAPRDSIFVSIRQEEAAEKIRYAKRIYETLAERVGIGPGKMRRLIKDSYLNCEFDNGVRLTSFPAVPPRGRARADLYLDEFAHVQRDREIYTAALPIISKGGRLRIGSSPFGAVGMFWEVWGQAIRPYPGYTRKITPWYETYAFTIDVHHARRLAPMLSTGEAVERFGNGRILAIYQNMDEDDFRQEYCHLATTAVFVYGQGSKRFFDLRVGDELLYNKGGTISRCKLTNKGESGMKNIIKVTTETGSSFTASVGHKVKDRSGNKIEIEIAAELPYVFVQNQPASPEEALARLVAYSLGDGTIAMRRGKYKRVRDGGLSIYDEYPQASFYSKCKEDLYALAEDMVLAGIREIPPSVLFKKGSRPEFDAYQVHITYSGAQALLDAGAVARKKVESDFSVPDWIVSGSANVKREFLAALFGAEGNTPHPRTIDQKRNKYPRTLVLKMHRANQGSGQRFFVQLKDILADLGVDSTLTTRRVGDRFAHSIFISQQASNLIRFFSEVGYRYNLEKQRLAFLWVHYLKAYSYDVVMRNDRAAKLEKSGLTYREIAAAMGCSPQGAYNYAHGRNTKFSRSFPYFGQWVSERFEDGTLYLRVVDREQLPPEETYNITVDSPDHSYLLADGIDNFNCAEIVDESRSFFTWDEIKAIQRDDLYCEMITCKGADVQPALEAIRRLAYAIGTVKAESVLAAGFDVGRTRNTSELYAVGLAPSGDLPLRLALTLDNTPYAEQEQVIDAALNQLPIVRLWMDNGGIGNQLAETAALDYPGKAAPAQFTNASKALWAGNAKMLTQKHRITIPVDRDLAYQIHSIKKLVTASKNVVFDTDANEKHHADKFWGWALALSAAIAGSRQPDPDALAALFDYVG